MDDPITAPLTPLEDKPTPEPPLEMSEPPEPSPVEFKSGFTLSLNTQGDLNMSKAGAFIVRANNNLELVNGGATTIVAGGNCKVENGGAQTIVVGGDMELINGGAALVIPGGDLNLNKCYVGVSLAKEANYYDGSQVILDTPRALLFGAAFGAVFALIRWLLRR